MPKIETTETLQAADGGDVTIRRTLGVDGLTLTTSGTVTLSGDEVRALAERLTAAALTGPAKRANQNKRLRTGPGECGDQRATHGEALSAATCTLQPGHEGRHEGGMYNWPQTPSAPCGSVKYWPGPLADDADRRTACDRDQWHKTPHEGHAPDGSTWTWQRDAACEAGQPGGDLTCGLIAGHWYAHQSGIASWPQPLDANQ